MNSDQCPRCGGEEWDRIEWNQWMGVSPFDTYRQCGCGHEWPEEQETWIETPTSN